METTSVSTTKKPPNRVAVATYNRRRWLPSVMSDPAPAFDRDTGDARSCPYCGRPFARERYLTLHVGLDHYDRLSEDERDTFVSEYRAETDEIKRFRLKALALLVAMYFTFLYLYLAIT
jgi:hypothetical protein